MWLMFGDSKLIPQCEFQHSLHPTDYSAPFSWILSWILNTKHFQYSRTNIQNTHRISISKWITRCFTWASSQMRQFTNCNYFKRTSKFKNTNRCTSCLSKLECKPFPPISKAKSYTACEIYPVQQTTRWIHPTRSSYNCCQSVWLHGTFYHDSACFVARAGWWAPWANVTQVVLPPILTWFYTNDVDVQHRPYFSTVLCSWH